MQEQQIWELWQVMDEENGEGTLLLPYSNLQTGCLSVVVGG